MRSRRLAVEQLESRVVLSGLGTGLGASDLDWVSVIVSLREETGTPQGVAQGVLDQFGGRLGHIYQHALNGFSAQLPSAAVAALSKNPQVKTVEPDMVLHTMAQTVPTGVMRIGTLENSTAAIGTGRMVNVGIAIIDTGIQPNHPDLNVVGGVHYGYRDSGPPARRGFFEDNNYNDDHGHGTHVAGIAAALDNDIGVVGVAPGARLYAVKVLDSSGSGYLSNIIKGIDWVTANSHVIQVANMSLGGSGSSDLYQQAIQKSVAAGVVHVVAAGNDYRDILGADGAFGTNDDTIPAAYPEVATISAMADSDGIPGGLGPVTNWGYADDTFADFSNFSNSDDQNKSWYDENNVIVSPGLGIDLMMPGVDILSTYPGSTYRRMSGTSMAAPHAAGLAALYIAEHGRANNAEEVYQIRQALIDGGKPWRSDLGLVSPPTGVPNPDSPDKHEENLGWAGDQQVLLTIDLTQPADSAVLYDLVEITAVASHADLDTSIDTVLFTVESETFVGQWNTAGYWFASWDTTNGFEDGDYVLTATAFAGQDSASTSITVAVQNTVVPTTVSITSPSDAATVSGEIEVIADVFADPRVQVNRVEFYADSSSIGVGQYGSDGWLVLWDSAQHPDGHYAITAVASDSIGNNVTSKPISVAVQNQVATMTAELSGRATTVNRNFWRAEVTVNVVDAFDAGIVGAAVSGRWSTNSTVSGTTGSSGTVTFESGNLRNNVSSIRFDLSDVQLAGYQYDSNATSITVNSNGSTTIVTTRFDASLILQQTLLAESLTGPKTTDLPSGFAGSMVATVSTALTIVDDDALRVVNAPAQATTNTNPPGGRATAALPRAGLDDLPVADYDDWPLYAAAVDQLLAADW